jgi:hypothetical protein
MKKEKSEKMQDTRLACHLLKKKNIILLLDFQNSHCTHTHANREKKHTHARARAPRALFTPHQNAAENGPRAATLAGGFGRGNQRTQSCGYCI